MKITTTQAVLLLVPRKLLQRFFYCFSVFWLAKVESSQKSNRTWFFWHFFAPYLQRRNKNNTSDKLRNKVLARKNVQKAKFEAAEMILDPWNQRSKKWVEYWECPLKTSKVDFGKRKLLPAWCINSTLWSSECLTGCWFSFEGFLLVLCNFGKALNQS